MCALGLDGVLLVANRLTLGNLNWKDVVNAIMDDPTINTISSDVERVQTPHDKARTE
jgi:hypothetical protein